MVARVDTRCYDPVDVWSVVAYYMAGSRLSLLGTLYVAVPSGRQASPNVTPDNGASATCSANGSADTVKEELYSEWHLGSAYGPFINTGFAACKSVLTLSN